MDFSSPKTVTMVKKVVKIWGEKYKIETIHYVEYRLRDINRLTIYY